MQSHFIALVGLDYDRDIVPHWVRYYKRYEFDHYHVWLHVNGDTEEKPSDIRTRWRWYFEEYGFTVHDTFGVFKNGTRRLKCLKPYHESVPDGDYIVCADSDEFQQIEPEEYRRLFSEGWDVIEGTLIERFSRRLVEALPDIPLDRQYPRREKLDEVIEHSHHFAPGVRHKILAVKAPVMVNYIGSHRTHSGVFRRTGDYIVDHYTCRATFLARMRGKTYYHPEAIIDVARFFGHTDEDECIQWLYKELADQIRDQGWIPDPAGGVLRKV